MKNRSQLTFKNFELLLKLVDVSIKLYLSLHGS